MATPFCAKSTYACPTSDRIARPRRSTCVWRFTCFVCVVQVQHPAAKSLIELSRAQDEAVGDGTTAVVILAGEVLLVAVPYIELGVHPTRIIKGYVRALEDALAQYAARRARVVWRVLFVGLLCV